MITDNPEITSQAAETQTGAAEKPKQRQIGKTKLDLKRRAQKIVKEILNGQDTVHAMINAGYSPSYALSQKDQILSNPTIQRSFNAILEAAGVTDEKLAAKIRSLIDAKDVKYYAHQGIVTDKREVEALAIQAQMVEFAAKLKGHVRATPEGGGPGNTYIDMSSISVQIGQPEEGGNTPHLQAIDITADK